VLSGETANTNFIAFGLIEPGFELEINTPGDKPGFDLEINTPGDEQTFILIIP